MPKALHSEKSGAIARLTLSRPREGNPLDAALAAALQTALGDIGRDRSVRVVVLAATGYSFCSGSGTESGDLWWQALASLRACRVPIVVALNGDVLGEGILLALSGDWVLAAGPVRFLQVDRACLAATDLGLDSIPSPAMVAALQGDPGLSARPLSAAQAHQWGLVNECLAPEALDERVDAVAAQLGRGPTRALVATRHLVDQGMRESFERQCRLELEANLQLRESADGVEGVQAFLEKRPARFSGE